MHDWLSDLKCSTRSWACEFPEAKVAARTGQAVEIVDGRSVERLLTAAYNGCQQIVHIGACANFGPTRCEMQV